MPISDATRRIALMTGRIVWAILFVPFALLLGSIAFDTQVKSGPHDQYWPLFYGVVMWAIVFLAPFLPLLRGKIPFKTAATASGILALGASFFFAAKEYALSPTGVAARSELEHGLNTLPYSAFVFALGAGICWALAALGRAVFPPSP